MTSAVSPLLMVSVSSSTPFPSTSTACGSEDGLSSTMVTLPALASSVSVSNFSAPPGSAVSFSVCAAPSPAPGVGGAAAVGAVVVASAAGAHKREGQEQSDEGEDAHGGVYAGSPGEVQYLSFPRMISAPRSSPAERRVITTSWYSPGLTAAVSCAAAVPSLRARKLPPLIQRPSVRTHQSS